MVSRKKQRKNAYRATVADKQVAKSAVWRMDPEVAQEFACMVPSRSSLERVSRRAW
jgi:hypothetical protein